MKKIDEMMQTLETLKNETRELLKENKVAEAKDKMKEVNEMKDAIEIQRELDKEDQAEVKNIIKKEVKDMNKEVKNKEVELFANYIKGKTTQEEREALERKVIENKMSEGSKADGGALVPVDNDTSIIALREAGDALQNLVTVVPVSTLSGKKTVRLRKAGGTNFKLVGEGAAIGTGQTPTYKEIQYSCKKYASIYDITNEFADDSAEDINRELNLWIGSDSRELRNKLIIDELAKKSPTEITGVNDIKKVKNVTLNTENSKFASILTNQDGFNYLDTLTDKNGNYLLQPVVGDATKFTFLGMNVDVKDNSILPSTEEKAPIFIGDFKMAVVLFDRKQVSVKVSTEGGNAFSNDLTLLRAIERNDIQTLDADAFVYGQVDITPAV